MAEKNSLWKNIRNKAKQNRSTGAKPKKPTAEMLRQERKIKAKKYPDGGSINPSKQKAVASTTDVSVRALPEGLFEQVKLNPPARQPQTISVVDKRKQNPITKKPINPNKDLVGGKFEDTVPIEIIKSSYKHGVDPATALSVGLLESRMGTTDPNVGHIMVDPYSDYMPGSEDMVLKIKEKQDYAKKLGYTDPLLQLQAYNGLGILSNKRGEVGKFVYGLPIPKEGIDLRKNPLYGKKVKNVRDSVIMQSPDLVRLMDYYKPKMDGGYMYYAGGPMEYSRGGNFAKHVAAGTYALGEGMLDTVTGGATDQLTDKGFEWLTKVGNKNMDLSDPANARFLKTQQQIKGYSNTAAAVTTGVFTGNVSGAIQQGTKGLNTAFQASDWATDDFKKWSNIGSQAIGIGAGIAGGALNTEGASKGASEAAAKVGEIGGKVAPYVNQAVSMFGSNSQPMWQQAQAEQDLLNSPELAAQQALRNQQYVNQGLSFAASGGNINNNSLNLQTDSMRNRYKKYKSGGSTNKFGVNFIPDDAGIHDENSYGGVPIGPQSLAEGGEAVIYDNQGNPSYVMPDQVNGVDNMKDFTITSNGKIKYSKETLAKAMERKLNKLRGDSISKHTTNQIKNEYISKRETLAQINAIEDTKKTVMEEYVAAYGGKLPNKYKGKINMPSMKAKGGPMVSNIKQPFEVAAQNRGGMMMARGGMINPEEQIMQLVQAYAEATGIAPEEIIQQLQQMEPQAQQQAIQQMGQELQGGQQQSMRGQQEIMPQEMAHGGYIQYARGGDIGGLVELTPTQEYFANQMYKMYGKVVLTDKATNETIYGTKKKDGTWDLNKFEVLTGANDQGQEISPYSTYFSGVDDLDKLSSEEAKKHKITPLGVWGLSYNDNIYGMPGYSLGNSNVAYHVTYKGKDDPNRDALYYNKNTKDNYKSYGCVNCQKPSMQALLDFAGKDGGFATVIDSRITPEENLKYMVKNTPSTASKFQKPKAVNKPAVTPANKPAPSPSYNTRFSAVPSNLQSGTKKPAAPRPKTEQIKKQIQKQVASRQINQPAVRAVSPSQMPTPRKSVQQIAQKPVMQRQAPASEYKGSSIVDYLASTGQDFSKEARAKLAAEYGIENYNYTAEDNLNLLDKLRNKKSSQYAIGGMVYAVGGPPYDLPGMSDMNPLEYNSVNTYLNNLNTPNYIDNQGNMSSILGRVNNARSRVNNTISLEGGPGRRIIGYDEYGQPIYSNVLSNSNQPAAPEVNYGNDYFLNKQPSLPMESYNQNISNVRVNSAQQVQPTNMFNVRNLTNLPDESVDYVPLSNIPVDAMQSMNLQQPLATNNLPLELLGNIQSLDNNDFYGLDADGNPVSINPDMYYKYQTGQFTPEGATLSPGKGFFNKAMDRLTKDSTKDALVAAGQLTGPLHQFFQKKPKPFNYNTASARTVDPTEAIAIADAKLRQSENVLDYNTRQNAPSSGSYLANARANALTFGNKRAITGAGIKQQYDLNNANILNQFEQYNTELENKAIEAHQQDLANWQEQRTNALYNAGANIAGMYKDKKTRDMYEKYVIPQIGTANYELVDGKLVPRQSGSSNFQVTKPGSETTTTPDITLKEDNPAVTNQLSVGNKSLNSQSLSAGTFDQNDPEQVKAFQDWMDDVNPNWVKGTNLNSKGKGYGRFGPSTKAAYDKYIYDYYGIKPTNNEFPI